MSIPCILTGQANPATGELYQYGIQLYQAPGVVVSRHPDSDTAYPARDPRLASLGSPPLLPSQAVPSPSPRLEKASYFQPALPRCTLRAVSPPRPPKREERQTRADARSDIRPVPNLLRSIDALDFEIIGEEEVKERAEARAAAAAVAVDMGAIDLIKHGSPEAVAKRGLVLAPLDAPGSVQEPSLGDAGEDPAVAKIEKCCVEWRAGRIKPRWIFLIDSKSTGSFWTFEYLCDFARATVAEYECALQIKLSLHLFRVFSVDVVHPSFEAAKAACAEGILDFIKFGNGQTVPAERRHFQPQEDDAVSSAPPIALTLQGFFEAPPRPLPEPVDDKTVAEINAPGWLNALIQSARGGSSTSSFGSSAVCTYVVEPQFPKRADAKNAVCLVALAAGVGAYIRSIITALETKISVETKTLVLESCYLC
ncbi:hypothetical protein BC826DRAFT_1179399 [Russula brevipes]|nr:hypothetical protein BC826DRAFT_1179399 [Russula brevipes]